MGKQHIHSSLETQKQNVNYQRGAGILGFVRITNVWPVQQMIGSWVGASSANHKSHHLMCKYTRGDGPMKEVDCWRKCTVDCK